jgi:hypothetical protein
MGQVCSGAKDEESKGGILDVPSQAEDYTEDARPSSEPREENSGDGPTDTTDASVNEAPTTEASAALADLEKRKRRELWIVNGAARGMVAVRSTRGSTGYYDQGFAGLLAQHLEQTTSFPSTLPLVLPARATPKETTKSAASPSSKGFSSKESPFYEMLARPDWEGMELVVDDAASKLRGREASAAASGDPHKLMDALAESLLDGPYTVLPAKQQLFAGVRPMVENLL